MVINQHIYRCKLELFEMIYSINNIALKIIARLYGPLARIMKKYLSGCYHGPIDVNLAFYKF